MNGLDHSFVKHPLLLRRSSKVDTLGSLGLSVSPAVPKKANLLPFGGERESANLSLCCFAGECRDMFAVYLVIFAWCRCAA